MKALIIGVAALVLTGALAQDRPLPPAKPGDTPQCAELRAVQSLMYRGLEDQGVVDLDEALYFQYISKGHGYLWDALAKVERLVKACST